MSTLPATCEDGSVKNLEDGEDYPQKQEQASKHVAREQFVLQTEKRVIQALASLSRLVTRLQAVLCSRVKPWSGSLMCVVRIVLRRSSASQ